jgi:hypothetical protein
MRFLPRRSLRLPFSANKAACALSRAMKCHAFQLAAGLATAIFALPLRSLFEDINRAATSGRLAQDMGPIKSAGHRAGGTFILAKI